MGFSIMTSFKTEFVIAAAKALKVIQSCRSLEQLKHAETYVKLCKNRFYELFINNNNKELFKQQLLLDDYIKYQLILINQSNEQHDA